MTASASAPVSQLTCHDWQELRLFQTLAVAVLSTKSNGRDVMKQVDVIIERPSWCRQRLQWVSHLMARGARSAGSM
eukprot:CAMPEP_0185203510 /NCGR_PEP_ID=MMETSP1140-20130426/53126_1 /TAXON_ID=298111 /ORGANISM="Pavlova sp., Strain CCMP459" /LENGTH=75 /DNA_ID=CAMNT_0027771013 /DNA_START=202 /DNA_END=427 /DNA_ORIENTATION=-